MTGPRQSTTGLRRQLSHSWISTEHDEATEHETADMDQEHETAETYHEETRRNTKQLRWTTKEQETADTDHEETYWNAITEHDGWGHYRARFSTTEHDEARWRHGTYDDMVGALRSETKHDGHD